MSPRTSQGRLTELPRAKPEEISEHPEAERHLIPNFPVVGEN
jgi:hypothetical protein